MQWLARARKGDPSAIDVIVRRLRPRLTRMAAYYARVCHEDADDLQQEAWAGLLEALPNLDLTIGQPEQYLIQCARWRLLDAIKRAHRRQCLALEDVGEEIRDQRTVECAAGSAIVSEFVMGLKETQRDVLTCLLAGLTWREAGAQLGCSSANIAYHVRQIRERYSAWAGGSISAEGA